MKIGDNKIVTINKWSLNIVVKSLISFSLLFIGGSLFIFLMLLMAQIIRKATIITTTAMIHPNRYSLACGLFVARE